MKTISAGMAAIFKSRHWTAAKLFTFTLASGTVLRYTSYDQDLGVGGNTFSCGGFTGPFFERNGSRVTTHRSLGLEVDTLKMEVIPGSGKVEGFPFDIAVRLGLFDGAEFIYHRINMATPGDTSAGTILMFTGHVAEITDISPALVTFSINSFLDLLNQQLPRNIFQPGCVNTLFDASCTLSAGSFTSTGAVVSGTITPYSFPDSTLSQATAYFNLGRLRFTSGANAGPWRSVQNYTHGTPNIISVTPPFSSYPGVGDTFEIVAGCDKTRDTCTNRFSNIVNFRGTPFIPQPETAI